MITLQLQQNTRLSDGEDDWSDWFLLQEYRPYYRTDEKEILAAIKEYVTKALVYDKNKQYRLVWVKSEVVGEINLPITFPKE